MKGLIPKLLIGIFIGLILGLLGYDWIFAITETGRILLGNIIKFFIPLIIIGFVAAGIADFRGEIGKMLGFTVTLAYLDTVIAIGLAISAAYFIIPEISAGFSAAVGAKEIAEPFMEIEILPLMDILSALLLAFVIGIGATWSSSSTIRNFILEFRTLILFCVHKIILPIIPFFIAFTFTKLTAEGEIFSNIPIFAGMFLLILIIQFIWLAIEYSVAGLIMKQNPLTMLKALIPAYLTGLGTMSSAVTMPVVLRQSKTVSYMNKKICDFAIPLLNTVHQAGAAIGIAIGAITVSVFTTGGLPPIPALIAFALLLGIIEVGAVGVPGGSILAALGVLQSTLGFDEAAIGLMITLFTLQDGFGTATNVTGDGALTMIINRFFGKDHEHEDDSMYEENIDG